MSFSVTRLTGALYFIHAVVYYALFPPNAHFEDPPDVWENHPSVFFAIGVVVFPQLTLLLFTPTIPKTPYIVLGSLVAPHLTLFTIALDQGYHINNKLELSWLLILVVLEFVGQIRYLSGRDPIVDRQDAMVQLGNSTTSVNKLLALLRCDPTVISQLSSIQLDRLEDYFLNHLQQIRRAKLEARKATPSQVSITSILLT